MRYLQVKAGEVEGTVVEITYATRTQAQSACPPKKGEGDGASQAATAAASSKDEEAERKRKKLEEMRKKLEAFQAAQKNKLGQ